MVDIQITEAKMGFYKYVREAWKRPKENELWKDRLIKWRKEPVTVRLNRPTRIDRARSLGYKAKPGFIIVRQRVSRSKRQHADTYGGRRPKANSRVKNLNLNYRNVAERRAAEKYVNCEVLNSYPVGEDGKFYWFEVILVDRCHPQVLADPRINWIFLQKGRTFRGLTSSARKSRGLRKKGKGAEKARPSKSANVKRRELK